jgi:hypothetical protein
MDPTLNALILRARTEHRCEPGATPAEIAEAERRIGFGLPEGLREVLSAANGIRFWEAGDFPCRLLSVSELNPAHVLLEGDEGPRGLIAVVETEGDVVAMDLDPESKSHSRLIDCFHETFPYELPGVCNSMQELLALILDSKGQEWSWPAARAYDVDFAEP